MEKVSKLELHIGAKPNSEEIYRTTRFRQQHIARLRLITATMILSCLLGGWLAWPFGAVHCSRGVSGSRSLTIDERVNIILSETPLIDGHDDFPLLIRYLYNNHIYDQNFTKPFVEGKLPGHVDLGKLRAGHNGGAFWSVFVPCPANGSDWSDENYAASVQFTFQQIDLVNRLQASFPSDFSGAVNSSTALAAFRRGQLISPLGVEGLHQIGNSVANMRHYHSLGVRYCTLTHNCGNIFADAALWESPKFVKAPPVHGGLSPLGRRLVLEMNRIGMMVDLSHTSDDTQVDVLGGREDVPGWNGARAPAIYSHSSAYALCPHPRNVRDETLRLVKATGSVVMVNFSPDFVSCVPADNDSGVPDFYPANSTLAQVARHVLYIGETIGFDHVGLGSDFDGIPTTPRGLEDVTKFPDLVAELLRLGVSDEDAAKVVGGNLLRVWRDVDRIALEMQEEGYPIMEDDLPDLHFEPMDWARLAYNE